MPLSDEEITREAAEKVMGWPTVRDYEEAGQRLIKGEGFIAEIADSLYEVTPVIGSDRKAWVPLERIEHAWELRDRLAAVGFVTVRNRPGHPEYCGFDFPDDPAFRKAEAFAPTSQRAICLCALRSVGVDLDEAGSPARFRVLPVPGNGFQVVERKRTPEGYDFPHGWTYSTEEEAEAVLPLIQAGNVWPSVDEVQAAVAALRALSVEPEGKPDEMTARRQADADAAYDDAPLDIETARRRS